MKAQSTETVDEYEARKAKERQEIRVKANAHIHLELPPKLKRKLRKLAALDRRSVNSYLRKLVENDARKKKIK